jgi:hypothetical protein
MLPSLPSAASSATLLLPYAYRLSPSNAVLAFSSMDMRALHTSTLACPSCSCLFRAEAESEGATYTHPLDDDSYGLMTRARVFTRCL